MDTSSISWDKPFIWINKNMQRTIFIWIMKFQSLIKILVSLHI
jgi:hypothetical protein